MSKLPHILVIGSSGHAKVVLDILEKEGRFRVVGLIDSFRPAGETSFGYEILGSEAELAALARTHAVRGCLVAVGDNWKRSLVVENVRAFAPELEFITAVHPSAQIARGVTVGRGVAIMAGAVINSDCRVGDFCLINTNASLDHDGVMDDFSSLAPNATAGGNVQIGAFSAVSLGASIVHRRRVGGHSVVAPEQSCWMTFPTTVLRMECPRGSFAEGRKAIRIFDLERGERSEIAAALLFDLQRFEEGLEIALAERLAAATADDLEK